VLKGDKEAQKNLPKIMKDELNAKVPSSKRSFSTSTRRSFRSDVHRPIDMQTLGPTPGGTSPELLTQMIRRTREPPSDPLQLAREVALAEPKAQPFDFRERYVDIVDQFVGLMIKDGKKAQAQRVRGRTIIHCMGVPPC
jgi:hypothetical protein